MDHLTPEVNVCCRWSFSENTNACASYLLTKQLYVSFPTGFLVAVKLFRNIFCFVETQVLSLFFKVVM